MSRITTFQTPKESLEDILKAVRDGKTQLPDFQRDWVWDDDHIVSLLASISLNYPIGAVMVLQVDSEGTRFLPRPVEGAAVTTNAPPEALILDGQQRITSLFQALFRDEPVTTKDAKGKPIKRHYYIDIRKALSPGCDREDAIASTPADRVFRNFRGEPVADYSSEELECLHEMFPLPLIFDTARLFRWQTRYVSAVDAEREARMERWIAFQDQIIQRFLQYQVPVILLLKDTPKEAVCQVFEKVNTGGVPLTVFELLTATYAVSGFRLRDDWAERRRALVEQPVTRNIESSDFLQAVSLLATYYRRKHAVEGGISVDRAPAISCKRKDILDLELEEYQRWAPEVLKGYRTAARLLTGLSIFSATDVPYRTQLTPLAAALAMLGSRWESASVREKLSRWFWCGVFGEMYGGTTETRFARDLPELLAWMDGGAEPATITEANFAESRLLTLRTRNSAAYKGIYALLMREGCLDFRTGEAISVGTYFDEQYDVHHIFPQKYCIDHRIDAKLYDSIINKTAISARTNRIIGGNAPSIYLGRLSSSDGMPASRLDEVLRSHLIEPMTCRADDFEAFFDSRRIALLARIEAAMGKPCIRDWSLSVPDDGLTDAVVVDAFPQIATV